MHKILHKPMLLLLLTVLAGPLSAQDGEKNPDPWQGMNRAVFKFNDFTDRYLLKPVAQGYVKVLPGVVRQGIGNFFTNLGTPAVALNQLLQGKPKDALSDTGRFFVNTTIGLGGFIDVGTKVGLPSHQEDFGQTFGVWGVPSGQYLVLPFMGSSSVRDGVGQVLSTFTNPIGYLSLERERYPVAALYVIDLRADLLSAEALIIGDEYLFLRDAYLQRRKFLVNDGELEDDPFADDGFGDDDFDEDDFE
ncbi:MAG: VacJ family lipoprotein [Pseudomonadota bacterium]